MRLAPFVMAIAAIGMVLLVVGFVTDDSTFRVAAIGCQLTAAALLLVSSRGQRRP